MHKKLVWATDIHFDHAHPLKQKSFLRKVLDENPDFLLLTGDISQAMFVAAHLSYIQKALPNTQTFFVLGNHDFYKGSIALVRREILEKFSDVGNGKAIYCLARPYFEIDTKTALVGHDGWYDGVYADWFKSKLIMADYHVIDELKDSQCPLPELRYAKLVELAKEAALHVQHGVNKAVEAGYNTVYVLTHVPPFPQNSVYDGKMSDDTWMPHFSSGYMGDTLIQLAAENPSVEFIVLCGHSHGEATHKEFPNLICYTGKAKYKVPSIAKVFEHVGR
jgi:Icc protein